MIGELYTITGIRVTLVPEIERSCCLGCVFCNPGHDQESSLCFISGVEGLICGEYKAIYAKVDLVKGQKKQLAL